MIEPDSGKLAAKIAALRAQKAASAPAPAPKKAPRTSDTGPELPEELSYMMESVAEVSEISVSEVTSDQFVDSILSNIGILEAYDRWCSKPRPQTVRDEEEVIVRCPTPSHVDRSPSAALNQAKDVWTCFGCGASGDVIHLVGENKGLDPRIGTEFMELRKAMMRDLGYRTWTNSMGHEEVVVPEWFGKKPATIAPEEKVAPEQEIPVDTVPDELFSDDTAAASAVFEKKTPAELPTVDAEFLTTLDELDEIDGVKDKKDRVLNSFRDKVAKSKGKTAPKPEPEKPAEQPSEPEKEVEKPYLTPKNPVEEAEIVSEVVTKPSGTPMKPSKMPKFNLKDSSDPDLASVIEKKAPKREKSAPTGEDGGPDPILDGNYPTFDWRNEVPKGTPMYEYLKIATTDDSPEEYHVANFLVLIGLLLGRDVYMKDQEPVFATALTCIIGQTGVGKSKSERHINRLIKRVSPFDMEAPDSDGIKVIRNPGSGQYLTSLFRHEVEVQDPNDAKKMITKTNPGVRALVRWPEMSSMLSKSDREGKTMNTIQEIYDADEEIGGGSFTNKEYSAHNAFGSVCTTTQPKILKKIVSGDDVASGFLNRFWFIFGNRKQKHPRGIPIDILQCSNDVLKIKKWAIERRELVSDKSLHDTVDNSIEGGSGQLYDQFLTETIYPMIQKDQSDGMLARLDLTFKKLVLLFSANMTERFVSIEAINQAKTYFFYLVRCYELVTAQLISTSISENEQLVLESWQKYSEGAEDFPAFSISEMYHKGIKRKIPEVSTVTSIVYSLERAGMLEAVPSDAKRGPKVTKYRLTE